jgi:hypothetical protein
MSGNIMLVLMYHRHRLVGLTVFRNFTMQLESGNEARPKVCERICIKYESDEDHKYLKRYCSSTYR